MSWPLCVFLLYAWPETDKSCEKPAGGEGSGTTFTQQRECVGPCGDKGQPPIGNFIVQD